MLSFLGLALAATAFVVAGPVAPASATVTAISTTFQVPLPSNLDFFPPDVQTVVVSHDLALQTGETRRISDRLETTISSGEGAEVDNVIVCLDMTTGEQTQVAQASGTNHPGSGAGHIALYGSLLFTAPHTGTFRCQARTSTSDGNRFNYHMTAIAGTFPNGTWLQISNADEVGSHWWSNPTCNSAGADPCVYLGASGDPITTHIFQDGAAPYSWTAANDAVEAEVTATVQVTSCPHGSSSCQPGQWGPDGVIFGIGKPDEAVVRTHLEFVQLDAAGSFCRTNSSPDTVYSISNSVHHKVINYYMHPQISTVCGGSRRFLLRVVMTYVSGNPVKIDSGSFPLDYHSASNASAINSIRTTTATVPNVVGAGESSAVSAIQAWGLTVGSVFRQLSSAPAGTVLAQNAPGGVVEPTGSPVNLFVSLGSATVPNVLTVDQTTAQNRITAAGLTVGSVSQVNSCLDPGTVQSQNPSGGAQVQPGTAVNITVSTCTGNGGGGGGGGGGNPRQPL